jgi:hypothetical protein
MDKILLCSERLSHSPATLTGMHLWQTPRDNVYPDSVLTTTTILFIIQIFVTRERSARREQKSGQFLERWHPILNSRFDGLPKKVPQVKYNERIGFFAIWSYLHQAHRNLLVLANNPEIDLNG